GTVDVQAGTLNLSGGGVDTGATYTTTTGNGILQFGGGTRTLNNTSQITAANVTFSGSQTTTVSGTYNVAGTTTVSGGTATLTGTLTGLGNALVITGGTLSIGSSTASVATFTQSGGELTGSAVVTVTGPTVGVVTASNFSGGTQSGSGTTIAQHGATFSGNSGLDGGRTLQLNGASTTSGTSVGISLNATNPSTGLSDVGSGTLTILSGATFTDATTGTLTISTANRGVDEQRRHLHQDRCWYLDHQCPVEQHGYSRRSVRHAGLRRFRNQFGHAARGWRHHKNQYSDWRRQCADRRRHARVRSGIGRSSHFWSGNGGHA